MKRRVRDRNNSANRGFAKGGSVQDHRDKLRVTFGIGKIFGWITVALLVTAAIISACFGIKVLMNKGEALPQRITVIYSDDISVKYDREEIYRGETLYLDFDTFASVFGLTRSETEKTVEYFTKDGDSLVFVTGGNGVTVNGISSPAGGDTFLSERGTFMAPAYVIDAYVNDTVVNVSKDNKTVTIITVADSISFNPKKSETLEGMSKPSSLPSDTKYDPNGTLPPSDITEPETTLPETTKEETTIPETTEPSLYPSDAEIFEIISNYTFKTDVTEFKAYMNPQDNEQFLILANRENPIGASYVPAPVWQVPTKYTLSGKTVHLRDNAYMALYAMIQEMIADGAWDTSVCSGYRSYSYQEGLYNRYFNAEKAKNPGLSDEEIYAIVDTYSARPGTSDHQTGLCVDFYELETTFENRKAFKWLEENAYKFGFILRFPEGKSDITGYMYEPWHWRFVGQLSAYKIHYAGLTLEEFSASRQ